MKPIIQKLIHWAGLAIKGLDFISPSIDLVARIWIAKVFWLAGMTKINSWDTTLSLFEEEYQVPLLSPDIAAVLATSVELGGAVLLVMGLGARGAATALFILNIVAAISYPDLSEAGLKDHYYWGLFLAFFIVHGAGKLSFDQLIRRKFM